LNPTAVERAEARYKRAELALLEFRAADNYQDAESAWTVFLTSASSIYSQLEQGAKGHGRAEGWYGRQKRMRKDNPILCYLHFARNAEEHGIERITAQHPDGGLRLGYGERRELAFQKTNPISGEKETPFVGWVFGPHLKLTRAFDRRFNDYRDPPEIKGSPAGDPASFADSAMALLRGVLDEAQTFV
jgi:hypothetical protein